MLKNLDNYVKIYNVLDLNICQETVQEIEEFEFDMHTYYNVLDNSFQSYDKELYVSNRASKHKEYFMRQVWHTIQKYILDCNFPWLQTWAGYSSIRYNKYTTGSQMKLHCDHIHSLFPGERKGIPILSIVGCLNEDFEGGKFIMFDDTEIKLKTGDVLVFPSNFLYPHQVTEVTKGTRYSFVSWTW